MYSGSGNQYIDKRGLDWLDMQSGILNTPLGHGSNVIEEALHHLVRTGLINSYDRTPENTIALCEFMDTIYAPGYKWKPFNTGAEGIEKAIQIASTYFNKRPRIAVLPQSFHGKFLSMAWANYGDKLPWGNPMGLIQIDPSVPNSIPMFDVLIYEPVQGWDGTEWDETILRRICDERGALLIADEMITGFLRCGKRFMSETADIIVTGKGISGGVPLSLVGYRSRLLPQDTIPVGWRSTGAGNNLSCTIGLHMVHHLLTYEHTLTRRITAIAVRLTTMGFYTTGALGFRRMNDAKRAKDIFERRRIIASWHCHPQVRVGPSFITTDAELDRLQEALDECDRD